MRAEWITIADDVPAPNRPACHECGRYAAQLRQMSFRMLDRLAPTFRLELCTTCLERLKRLLGPRRRRPKLSRREIAGLAMLAQNPRAAGSLATINAAMGGYATHTVRSLLNRNLVAAAGFDDASNSPLFRITPHGLDMLRLAGAKDQARR